MEKQAEAEQDKIMKMKCREKIKYLYKRSRWNLSLQEKDISKLPLRFRQKGTVEGMKILIETVETIPHQKDKDEKNNLDITNWFPPQKIWIGWRYHLREIMNNY